jgi:signal transduction histidine kinase
MGGGALAEDKKQTVQISEESQIKVSADRNFLRVAVINLLDNAVKYSPAGRIIPLGLSDPSVTSAQPRFAELAIEDQRPGIPEDKAARVFDRFYRVDEGAGLGVPIAK